MQPLVIGKYRFSLAEWAAEAIDVAFSSDAKIEERVALLVDSLASGSMSAEQPRSLVVAEPLADAFLPLVRFASPRPASADTDPIGWPFEGVYGGLTCLLAGTGGGKTTYLEKTLRPDVVIRVSEPFEEIDRLDHALSVDNLVAAFLIAAALSLRGVRVAVDSMHAITEMGGNTLSGGIDSGAFNPLRVINNWFAGQGVSVVGTLNPMLVDVELRGSEAATVVDYYARLIEASVVGVIYLKSYKPVMAYRAISGRKTLPVRFDDLSSLNDTQQLAIETKKEHVPDTASSSSLVGGGIVSAVDPLDPAAEGGPDFPGPRDGFPTRRRPGSKSTVIYDL